MIASGQIPDYDKVMEKANPLDFLLKKIESIGETAEGLFYQWDDFGNSDGTLTVEEIKEGCRIKKIPLTDPEARQLRDVLDADADGVVTMTEFQNFMQPKLDSQAEYIKIMGGPNGWGQKINDPLLLEEEILNTLFEVRYYNLKIKDLRRTQGAERVFKKKQLENQQKAMGEKIKNLESEVKEGRLK